MTKNITTILIDEDDSLTLDELCRAMQSEPEFIIELVEHELIFPRGKSQQQWQFDSICIHRVKTAVSFYHDLDINMHGVALALDLLDQIEKLETQIKQLKKYER